MNLSPLPIQKFFDNNNRPLVGGKLFTYGAGTSIKVPTYIDSTGGTPNTNPVILDFRGECRVWIDPQQAYKFVLAPANDSDPPTDPIWSVDNITAAPQAFDNAAVDTGSVNNISLDIPQISSPVAFTRVVFKASHTNTGPTTLQINGGTAYPLTWQNTAAFAGGEIQANGLYEAIFDGIRWQLQGPALLPSLLRTASEISAGITPINYSYEPGNVRRYGATGDGVTNDATAIENAILVAGVSGGNVYFPAGTYMVLAGPAGIEVTSKNKIYMHGSGATIKRAAQGTNINFAIFTFNACSDLIFDALNFDINGLLHFGGAIKCYGGQRISVRDCYFYDSNPGVVTSDRYHLLFTHDFTHGLCEYVSVRGCTLDGGQLEANANYIKVDGNSFLNAVNRAVTVATNGNNRTFRQIHICGNTFRSAKDAFIGIGVDPSTDTGALLEDFVIDGNTFEASADGASEAISITSTGATNTLRDFVITNNVMRDIVGQGFIKIDIGGNTMTGLQVTGNIYHAFNTSIDRPYFFQFIEEAIVAQNIAYGSVITRAFYFTQFKRCTFVDNQAEATTQAYEFASPTSSTTGTNCFRRNKVLGTPTTTFSTNDVNSSDNFDVDINEIKSLVVTAPSFRRDGFHTLRLTAAGATTIHTIAGGGMGDEITLLFGDGNITMQDATGNIVLAGDLVATVNDTMKLKFDGTNWFELCRSVN